MVTTAKQYPVTFTLPSGQTVLLKRWTETDFEKLNMWVRKRYVAVMTELVQTFSANERHDFLAKALQEAATLNYGFGKGQELVLGDTHGSAYAGYLLIENPAMTFEQFYDMAFETVSDDDSLRGTKLLDAMSNAVYGDEFEKELEDEMAEQEENGVEVTKNDEAIVTG